MLTDYWQRVRMIRRDGWIVVANAAAYGFMWTGILDTLLNLFLLRMGYGPQFVGLSMATAALGYALAALPAAAITRWLGLRRAMIVGAAIWVAGMLALSTADLLPGPWRQPWILGMRILAISGLSLDSVSRYPLLTGVTTPEERPHAFALLWSLNPLGGFLGSLVGGLLPGLFAGAIGVSLDHPRPYGYALALGLVIHVPATWALFSLSEMRAKQSRGKTEPSRGAVPYMVLGVVGLVCLLRVGGEFVVRTFFNVYMDSVFAAPAARIGTIMAFASLLTIPAPLIMPPLVGRLGRAGALATAMLGVAASVVLMGFSVHWVVAAVAFVCINVLAVMARSAWTLLTQEVVQPEWRSIAAGVSNLTAGLGVAVTSSVGGAMAAGLGYRSTFLTGAALVALGTLVFWLYFRAPRAQVAMAVEVDSRGLGGRVEP
jgi:MFS family permease